MIRSDEPCPVCGDKLYPVVWDGRDVGVQCAGGICDWPGRLMVMLEKEHDSVTPEGEVGMDIPEVDVDVTESIYEQLGLDGQRKYLDSEVAKAEKMGDSDLFLMRTLCPEKCTLKQFAEFHIPLDALEQLGQCEPEKYETLEIHYNHSPRRFIIVGVNTHPTRSWEKQYYGLVEFGLPPLNGGMFETDRMTVAKGIAKYKIISKGREILGKLEARVEALEEMSDSEIPLDWVMNNGDVQSPYLSGI